MVKERGELDMRMPAIGYTLHLHHGQREATRENDGTQKVHPVFCASSSCAFSALCELGYFTAFVAEDNGTLTGTNGC